MPFNPNDEKDADRLRRDIDGSRRGMSPFIRTRRRMIERFIGDFYGSRWGAYQESDEQYQTPVNHLSRATSLYVMALAGGRPQVLMDSKDKKIRALALDMEAITNEKLKTFGMAEKMQDVVTDALFGIGCFKVGLDYGGALYDEDDEDEFELEPFVETVSLEDLILDLSSARYDQMAYHGNFYRVPEDFFRDAAGKGFYKKKVADRVQRVTDLRQTETGEERAIGLLSMYEAPDEGYRPVVELMDVWLPDERMLITMPGGEQQSGQVLRVVELEGPQWGPYHFLDFIRIPGLPMPSSLIAELIPLHDAINRLVTKTVQSSINQKTIFPYAPGHRESAQAVRDARDGEMVEMSDPSAVTTLRVNGPDNQIIGTTQFFAAELDAQGGNLSTLGGLKPGARTIGQEQMMQQAASQKVAFMRDEVKRFSERVIRHLAWHWWNDSNETFQGVRKIKGYDWDIEITIPPEAREQIDILRDMSLSVEPFSLSYQSPEDRLGKILQVTNMAAPMLPFMAQQGVTLNFAELFGTIAKYSNLPEIDRIIESGVPQQDQEGGKDKVRQNPVTDRKRTDVYVGKDDQQDFQMSGAQQPEGVV